MIRNSRRVVALAFAGAFIAPVISGCGAGANPQSAAPTQLTEGVNVSVPKDATPSQVDVRNMFLLGPQPDRMLTPGASVPLYATIFNQVRDRADKLVGVESPDFTQARITGGAIELPAARPSGESTPVTLTGKAAAVSPTPAATGRPTTGEPTTGEPGATPSATPSGRAGGQATGRPSPSPSGTARAETPASPDASPTATARPTGAASPGPEGKAPTVVLTGLKRQLLGGETIKVKLTFEKAGSVETSVPVVPKQHEYAEYTSVTTGVPAPGASATPSSPSPGGGGHGAPADGHGTPEGGHGGSPSPSPASTASPADGGH